MAQTALASRPSHSHRPVHALTDRLWRTRRLSVELTAPLTAEDMTAQAMDDASPTKWHLAHTTWFFEAFILAPYLSGYEAFDEAFNYCFNSYYERQGARHPRPKRGLLTRPSLDRILAYREHVDLALTKLFAEIPHSEPVWSRTLEVGIHHEQQHQELMLTDILALFANNPLRPAYRAPMPRSETGRPQPFCWIHFPYGIYEIGYDGDGFAWDNETPRHNAVIYPFRLADRLVTQAEWLEFIEDDGYKTATLWLSDGWAAVNREKWRAPLYWEPRGGQWCAMSLEGLQPLELSAPVSHVSYYEADAFARWAGRRLPTEFEWEVAAARSSQAGNFLESDALRPLPAKRAPAGGPSQMFGDVWEWTQSAYLPYPGYMQPKGALGEYNGKFMVSQQVLRGGACVTPENHVRASYRNFFYPNQRWQFAGVRLASEMN